MDKLLYISQVKMNKLPLSSFPRANVSALFWKIHTSKITTTKQVFTQVLTYYLIDRLIISDYLIQGKN